MSDSSFDVDEILKEVRKRREENEERIKAQGTRKSCLLYTSLDEKRLDYILNHLKDWQVFITCCDAQNILRLKQGKTIKRCV